jgi:ceramide glucosyltransferase
MLLAQAGSCKHSVYEGIGCRGRHDMILYWSSIIAWLLTVAGCGYVICATLLSDRFSRKASFVGCTSTPGVTILKPLHGAEPGLLENLTSFCTQNYPGPVQIILGVHDPRDDAIAVVERLRAKHRADRIDLVVDETMHGLNRKVSNLINMWRRVKHEIIVVADSDILVDPDYLSRVVAGLDERGVGAVTCLYHGLATHGVWARLAALGINVHFLPNVVFGVTLGLAHPCFGSTIAFKRKILAEIGEFISIADCLADDYAIGARLRDRGYKIAVLPTTVGHVCTEMSMRELWQHEMRWARTVRSIDPVGYAGLLVTHAFPLALVAALAGISAESLTPTVAIGMTGAAFACRLALLQQVQRTFDLPSQSYWLLPMRDLLSFAVFLSSFVGRNIKWRGRGYRFRSRDGAAVTHGHRIQNRSNREAVLLEVGPRPLQG